MHSSDDNAFVTWWRRTHYENSMIDALCDRGHTPYRQIGHRAVSHVMDRCGIAYTQDEVKALVARCCGDETAPQELRDRLRLKLDQLTVDVETHEYLP